MCCFRVLLSGGEGLHANDTRGFNLKHLSMSHSSLDTMYHFVHDSTPESLCRIGFIPNSCVAVERSVAGNGGSEVYFLIN